MTATRLLLVRHGETTATEAGRFAGASDVPLSDAGRDQARRLSARLAPERLAAVYTSPLVRCVDTARTLAEPHGLPVERRDDLREIDHGRWEGLRRDEVKARFAEEYAAWVEDPFSFAPEGGTSGAQVVARAVPALREIAGSHPGRRVLVVTHKGVIRLALAILLGLDPRRYRDRIDQLPCALNVLDFEGAGVRLRIANDVSHYASGLDVLEGPGTASG